MRLIASITEDRETTCRAAAWAHTGHDVIAMAVWSENKPMLGEDAEPVLLLKEAERIGLVGVFDGLGGSGAGGIGRSIDGRLLRGAFIASRLAHLTVRQWFADRVIGSEAGTDLKSRLAAVMQAARPARRTKVRGSLVRALPTTIALMEFAGEGDHWRLTARWAGDSRCFVICPDQGMAQISRDDSAEDDALVNLIHDQPMLNVVSASEDFTINESGLTVTAGSIVMAATDGFFSWVLTPALFEYHVLETLHSAADAPEWGRRLTAAVRSYTSDDASLSAAALGYSSFTQVQKAFRPRYEHLRAHHWEPLAHARDGEAKTAARHDSWDRYRDGYMRFLRDDREAAPEAEDDDLAVRARGEVNG